MKKGCVSVSECERLTKRAGAAVVKGVGGSGAAAATETHTVTQALALPRSHSHSLTHNTRRIYGVASE